MNNNFQKLLIISNYKLIYIKTYKCGIQSLAAMWGQWVSMSPMACSNHVEAFVWYSICGFYTSRNNGLTTFCRLNREGTAVRMTDVEMFLHGCSMLTVRSFSILGNLCFDCPINKRLYTLNSCFKFVIL